jgi:hypothetical protein
MIDKGIQKVLTLFYFFVKKIQKHSLGSLWIDKLQKTLPSVTKCNQLIPADNQLTTS